MSDPRNAMDQIEEAQDQYREQIRRWRGLFVATFSGLAIVLIVLAVVVNLLMDASEVRGQELDRIETILDGLQGNQSGIEELVSFVRDVAESDDEGIDLQVFIDLLCSSEDPARIAACNALPPDLSPEAMTHE